MPTEERQQPEWVTPANPADPTKNVSEIVKAESRYQDGMREAHAKLDEHALKALEAFQNFARDSESRMQTWMRDAEGKRVDQLASQRKDYETQIASMLAASVTEKSSLVANQLLQIQNVFGERVSKLEEFRLLSTGRSSVSDPQIAASFDMINKNLASTQDAFSKALVHIEGKMDLMTLSITALQENSTKGTGREVGRHEMIAWIVAAVGFMVSIATGVALFSHLAPIAGHIVG